MTAMGCGRVLDTTQTNVSSGGMSALDILCSVATYPRGGNGSVSSPERKHRALENNRDVMSRDSSTGEGTVMSIIVNTDSSCERSGNEYQRSGYASKQHSTNMAAESNEVGTSIPHAKNASVLPPFNRASRRQSYTRFSPEEEKFLTDGVKKYGAGNWKKILCHYKFHWKRTPVDLKDKYRNMMKMRLKRKGKVDRLLEHTGHESDVSNSCLDGEARVKNASSSSTITESSKKNPLPTFAERFQGNTRQISTHQPQLHPQQQHPFHLFHGFHHPKTTPLTTYRSTQ